MRCMSRLLVIAGPAGSGKTTLADEFAAEHQVPHLDFDIETAAFVDGQRALNIDADEAELLLRVKAERYRIFAAAVSLALQGSDLVVATAPFTTHLQSLAAWDSWISQLPAQTAITVAWIVISPELRLSRMRQRGSNRDSPVINSGAPPAVAPPRVPHAEVPADQPIAAALAQLSALV
jgi:cytidylate kinase